MREIQNIKYSKFDDCFLDIYLPETDEFQVFVYFHGGGLEADDKIVAKPMASFLAKQGIAVVSANYRMYPHAVYPEFLRDSAAAVAWTKKHIGEYGNCKKIYVGGSSAGGYISMMLCFDKKYLAPYKIMPTDIDGFIHDAGQPTCHYNVLRERGIDKRRVIVDESSSLYHIGTEEQYPKMMFIVSDNDMENRYEQTMLLLSTMKHFKYNEPELKIMQGTHCEYVKKLDENGESIFGQIIYSFIAKIQ